MKGNLTAFCICLLFAVCRCYSQTATIDHLRRQINLAQNDQQRLDALFSFCEQKYSLNTDTLYKYAGAAKRLSISQNNFTLAIWADYYMANCYVKKGLLDTALLICNNNIAELQGGSSNKQALMKLTALKAQILVKSNKYKEALQECFKTLSLAEESNDVLMQMMAKNAVGWVYMEMEQNPEALKWFHAALRTSDDVNYHLKNANIYSNIAATYIAFHEIDSAEYYVKEAIDFSTKDENLFFLCNSLNILGDIYIEKKTPALAEAPLTKAIKIRELIGDPYYIVSDLSALAIFYARQSQPQKGIAACLKGIGLAKRYNLLSKLPYLQFALAQNYKAAKDYEKYSETIEKVLGLKDSVYQLNSEQAVAEIKNKYDHEKQQNIIIKQQLDINRKNSFLYGVLIIVFFAVVILILIFNNYKKKQQLIIEVIKEEEKRKAQEAVIAAEENERKRISADLHDNLGAYASAISSNVDDLASTNGNVDQSIIDSIKSNADDIMLNLRETIWVLHKTEIRITSISDRFKSYIARIKESYPELSVQIKEHIITDTALSPEYALNLLRIMQEAFHNSIKHSKGNRITIEITNKTNLHVIITDNGDGFTDKRNIDGNGIGNMKRRATASGWQLKVKSLEPKGTAVEVYSD